MTYPRLFVFDMIGTTVQPSEAIPAAFRNAVATAGVAINDEDIRGIRGRSKRQAIQELLTNGLGAERGERLQSSVYGEFCCMLSQHYRAGGAIPVADADRTFDWCRSVGAEVVLTSGFDREIVDLLLESLGWSGFPVICSNDVSAGRPAPDMILAAMRATGCDSATEVACIGDTLSDLQAGANAGVRWNFGVLSGAHDKARLSLVGPAIVLYSVADLPGYDW